MWVMVLGDFVFFGAYFIIFMVHRAMAPEVFLQSQQHLNLTIGVVNTLVLLTSSWFIARSVATARSGDHRAAVRLTYLGGACGVLFIAIKAYEWSAEIAAGHTMPSQRVLLVLLHAYRRAPVPRRARSAHPGNRGARTAQPAQAARPMVESGATYWHMVDLLWIVIFGLLYVMR